MLCISSALFCRQNARLKIHLFCRQNLSNPTNDIWETSAQIPYWQRVTTQIWVVTRHRNGISAFISQTSFGGETSGSVAKCRLFSHATASLRKDIFCFTVHYRNFLVAMADEDWAAEVDELERQISGKVSYCRFV